MCINVISEFEKNMVILICVISVLMLFVWKYRFYGVGW